MKPVDKDATLAVDAELATYTGDEPGSESAAATAPDAKSSSSSSSSSSSPSVAATQVDAPVFPAGTMVAGRYVVQRVLGRGGMGEVFEAIHQDLKKRVAIKTLHPTMARNADARARFQREGEAASRIHHPHIVDISDVGTHEGVPFLVMELLQGEDLDQLLAREAPLSVERTVDLLIPVLAAVGAAHERGVVHRDLKPSNIFLTQNEHGDVRPTVLDFGISKMTGGDAAHLTQSAAMLGTPLYMSPEQAQGAGKIDGRADQYSLGVILYRCVTGSLPISEGSLFQILKRIVEGDFQPPRALNPELPAALEAVILKAMARDAEARFPSVKEMGQALLPLAGADTRVLWRKTFGDGPPTGVQATLDARKVPLASTTTAATAPGHSSTLGGAVGQQIAVASPEPAAAPKSRMGLYAAVGLVVLGGAGFALRGALSPAPAPAAARVPAVVAAPAPAATPDLAPSPALAAPLPAPVVVEKPAPEPRRADDKSASRPAGSATPKPARSVAHKPASNAPNGALILR